jgi:phosphoglycolate phosphatase/putative hydrolase of the HAD superfamily
METRGSYPAVIFDVDGTLYYQKPLRRIMAVRLFLHYMVRPWRWMDLAILKTFRALREKGEYGEGCLAVLQYQAVADHLDVPIERVRAVVEKWMEVCPRFYLRYCKDQRLADWIISLRKAGVLTVAYSDYPVEEKLKALGIEMDFHFCATDAAINRLKPDPKGLAAILAALSLSAKDCLMVGDRDEKDGECARRVGMDYQILPSGASRRRTSLNQRVFNLY